MYRFFLFQNKMVFNLSLSGVLTTLMILILIQLIVISHIDKRVETTQRHKSTEMEVKIHFLYGKEVRDHSGN
jgi:energy-converting hydrogenase Eha subunit H